VPRPRPRREQAERRRPTARSVIVKVTMAEPAARTGGSRPRSTCGIRRPAAHGAPATTCPRSAGPTGRRARRPRRGRASRGRRSDRGHPARDVHRDEQDRDATSVMSIPTRSRNPSHDERERDDADRQVEQQVNVSRQVRASNGARRTRATGVRGPGAPAGGGGGSSGVSMPLSLRAGRSTPILSPRRVRPWGYPHHRRRLRCGGPSPRRHPCPTPTTPMRDLYLVGTPATLFRCPHDPDRRAATSGSSGCAL